MTVTVPALSELLAGVSLEEPTRWKGLEVFPLIGPNGHAPSCALIDELLERHEAEIAEISEGGSVPTIKVLNRSDHDALVLDGTELHGARQNRMVNLTIIAARGAETIIPVSCVEAHRWSYRARRFSSSRHTVASRLRNLKAHRMAEHLAACGAPTADQHEVWAQVGSYLARGDAPSTTQAMDDVFTRHHDRVEDVAAGLDKLDAHGAMVALHGDVVALDLFEHRDTFKRAWPSLLRGYAMDAVLEGQKPSKPMTRAAARRQLRGLMEKAMLTAHKVAGVGQYYAVRGSGIAGGVATHQGRTVHVALFPACNQGTRVP